MSLAETTTMPGGRPGGLLKWVATVAVMLAILMASLAALPATAATAVQASKPQTHIVEIRKFKFSPAVIEAKPGDTITWKNFDAAPHTATAQGWDSGRLNRGQSWSLKVTDKGTFEYICTYHPAMKGKVVVK